MLEDKAPFLEVVGRASGDDEVCSVSYVLGLEMQMMCLFLSHKSCSLSYVSYSQDGEYFVFYRLYVCVDEVLQLAV